MYQKVFAWAGGSVGLRAVKTCRCRREGASWGVGREAWSDGHCTPWCHPPSASGHYSGNSESSPAREKTDMTHNSKLWKKKKKEGGGGSGGGGDGDLKALGGDLTREESQEAERRARRAKTTPARLPPRLPERRSSGRQEAAAARLGPCGRTERQRGRPEMCVYVPLWSINPSFTTSFSRAWLIASILRRGRRRRRRWEQYSGDARASPFSAMWRMNFFLVVVAFEDEPARFFFLGMVIPFLSEGDGELCISDRKVDGAGLAHSEAGVWNYFQEEHKTCGN